jgi:hypothetical protein
MRPSKAVYLALIAAAVIIGILARSWFILHVPINSDEAVAGLIARNIIHGHFQAFYWGQQYGGVEPYVIAAFFGLFGQSPVWLVVTPVLLTAATAIVTWRIGLRLVSDPWLAALAGALVWAAPEAGIENSTIEYGFRSATLFCGALTLLFALRFHGGRRRPRDLVALGLAAGVSWWASPESIYFLIPSAAIVIAANVGWHPQHTKRWKQVLVVVASFCVGALPWLWSNVLSGFASLHSARTPGSTYMSHLTTFFARVLPIELGLYRSSSGARVLPGLIGLVARDLAEAIVVVLIAVCLFRRGPARMIAIATIAFPFLYALSPLAWWWQDGRYAIYLPVLLALVSIVGFEELQGTFFDRLRLTRLRRPTSEQRIGIGWARPAMAVTAATSVALAFATFLTMPNPPAYSASAGDPNGPTVADIGLLLRNGVTYGFADYWVAYRLDFLADGTLTLTPPNGNTVRSTPIYDAVADHRSQAWLFVTNSQFGSAFRQFGSKKLEAENESESKFLTELSDHGIGYRVVHAGMFVAVITERSRSLNRIEETQQT